MKSSNNIAITYGKKYQKITRSGFQHQIYEEKKRVNNAISCYFNRATVSEILVSVKGLTNFFIKPWTTAEVKGNLAAKRPIVGWRWPGP